MSARDEERRRRAMDRTARTLREAASKAGNQITHTEALDRVRRANAKRKEE